MKQNDFRVPVVYILDQELRKRNLRNKIKINNDDYEHLPDYPCRLIRNEKGIVAEIVYAENTNNEWKERLIRNGDNKVYQIETTYPNGETETIEIFKDANNKTNLFDYINDDTKNENNDEIKEGEFY